MNGRLNKKNAGFTLLEVILSMAILALISIPLLKYFSDSMRYNAMMEQKQKATILAQEIIEGMKAEDKLIAIPDGETAYTVPYLTETGSGYTLMAGSLESDGTGTISFTAVNGNYDVVVTLSTDTAANEVTRPIIYGIDDSTDVLAVEREQKQEAAAYFMAINNAYCTTNATGVLLSHTEIEDRLERTIQIVIGTDGSYYTVKVYYDYTCSDLRGMGSLDSWKSSYLLDVKIGQLKNIYLLYDAMPGGSDTILVSRETGLDPTLVPDLFLICQNTEEEVNSSYKLKVDRIASNQVIHTNISNTETTQTGQVTDLSGYVITDTLPLTGSAKPVRLIEIVIEIYPKGHSAGDEPLAAVKTTKGE